MKAMVVREYGGGWVEEDVQIDSALDKEVLIEVKASGLCASDYLYMQREIEFPAPSVLGHELAGIVLEVGQAVTDFKPGDRVSACEVAYCGSCDRCLAGEPGLCRHPEVVARTADQEPRLKDRNGNALSQGMNLGGFAEQALIHENLLTKVPDDIPWAQAAIVGCSVVTGAGAVLNAAQPRPSDPVAIIGAGGVGLNAVQGAKLSGAGPIIVIDLNDGSLEMARCLGATHTINSSKVDDPVAAVMEITGGHGVMHAFDIVGYPATARQGYDMLDRGGTLYQVGMGNEETFDLAPVDNIFTRKGLRGINMGSGIPRRDIATYFKEYQAERLELDALVSGEIKLSEINEAYEQLKDPKVNRLVITDFS